MPDEPLPDAEALKRLLDPRVAPLTAEGYFVLDGTAFFVPLPQMKRLLAAALHRCLVAAAANLNPN